MAHKFPNVLVHLVFSTKDRRDLVSDHELRRRLWRYFAGIGKNHGIAVLVAGGTANHAHLLIVLPSDVSVAKAVQVLKANSSRWLREHGIDFTWQEGYGAFSVSPSNAPSVKQYIEQQSCIIQSDPTKTSSWHFSTKWECAMKETRSSGRPCRPWRDSRYSDISTPALPCRAFAYRRFAAVS